MPCGPRVRQLTRGTERMSYDPAHDREGAVGPA